MFDRRLLINIDWFLCFLVLLLCLLGFIAMSSVAGGSVAKEAYLVRQSYWFIAGIGLALLTQFIHYRDWARLGFILHLLVILLLVLVLFYGTGGPGTSVQRWLKIGPFFIQPSEFSKFTLVLAVSHYFREDNRFLQQGWIWMTWPTLLMLIPVVLIIRQPDLGTALLLIVIFAPIVFMMGIRFRTILSVTGLILVSLPLVWIYLLKPYQQERILTFLNPDRDPLGTGYHVIQSKIAVGSGEFWGKGYGNGTQGQLNFLPADHTDFIFSVFSEEWGFMGSMTVLILFLVLTLWAIGGLYKSKNRVSMIQTVGVVAIITSHVLINIGMTLGLMPVVGVPLPFFSYGGSSMISMMFGIGLLLNIRMRRFEAG